ncbi:Putative fimbrial chaparone [Klebsiella pneumoniae subsp. pneumoniae ST258-K28BO]|nr:Putative fimbrial chaparone [Klebsiella pneumoniae subsp. pneumoniae ST258-K28BO]
MFRTLLNLTASCVLLLSSIAHAGIVIESTRYLYKEGAREITAQIENKDDIPYLIKSWVETPAGKAPSFMATPPLFRLEGKQQNTVRLFSTGNVNAPTDRESLYYFNVMAIRLIRCVCGKKIGPDPRNFNQRVSLGRNDLLIRTFPNTEAKKLEWRKAGTKLTIKNPTPFFYYFHSIQIGGKEVKPEVNSVAPMTTKEVTLKENISASSITWKIVNDYGGAGSLYSSSL